MVYSALIGFSVWDSSLWAFRFRALAYGHTLQDCRMEIDCGHDSIS